MALSLKKKASDYGVYVIQELPFCLLHASFTSTSVKMMGKR